MKYNWRSSFAEPKQCHNMILSLSAFISLLLCYLQAILTCKHSPYNFKWSNDGLKKVILRSVTYGNSGESVFNAILKTKTTRLYPINVSVHWKSNKGFNIICVKWSSPKPVNHSQIAVFTDCFKAVLLSTSQFIFVVCACMSHFSCGLTRNIAIYCVTCMVLLR